MWYVIQVRTGMEEEIRQQCERVIEKEILEHCFIPYCEQMKRYQGQWHKERKILFPGYVFLVSEDEEQLYHCLKKVIGLTKLIGTGREVVPLAEDEVDLLMEFGKEEQIVAMSEGIIEDDRVVVTSGPLKGHEGMIRKVDLESLLPTRRKGPPLRTWKWRFPNEESNLYQGALHRRASLVPSAHKGASRQSNCK